MHFSSESVVLELNLDIEGFFGHIVVIVLTMRVNRNERFIGSRRVEKIPC